MISFSVLNTDSIDAIIEKLFAGKEKQSAVREMLSDIDFPAKEEYAISEFGDCLLIRIFDGERYVFVFPIPLSDGADVSGALLEIEKYAIKEEIPLNLSSLSYENLPLLRSYLHMRVDAENETGDVFFVRVQNECQLLSEIPTEIGGRVKLNALKPEDIESYANLCRDEELLKYWGYDYRVDYSSASDEFFYESALSDFNAGVAMTMAVRDGERLVGSLEFYAFDFHGGAEIDIRIFPNEQGRGLGREALLLALRVAERIGLLSLRARVMKENAPSRALFEKYADFEECSGETVVYTITLPK